MLVAFTRLMILTFPPVLATSKNGTALISSGPPKLLHPYGAR